MALLWLTEAEMEISQSASNIFICAQRREASAEMAEEKLRANISKALSRAQRE